MHYNASGYSWKFVMHNWCTYGAIVITMPITEFFKFNRFCTYLKMHIILTPAIVRKLTNQRKLYFVLYLNELNMLTKQTLVKYYSALSGQCKIIND